METIWQQTQFLTPLSEGIVHVWCANLKVSSQKLCCLWNLLIEDEKNQANKFISVIAKESFIVSRSILRLLLSKYLNTTPKELIFRLGKYGKPYVQLNITQLPLQFNISHSGDLALFAFTLHNEVGVDIEYIRPDFDYEEIAPQFFSKQENVVLSSLPKEHRLEAFFTYWTRKEAFIKTIGEGLSFPLDKFDVALIMNEDNKPLSINIYNREIANKTYFLYGLYPAKSYVAALAINEIPYKIYKWYLNGEQLLC